MQRMLRACLRSPLFWLIALAAALAVLAIPLRKAWDRPTTSVLHPEPNAGAASPLDWPHLRGSNYDSISKERDLIDSWPGDGPPVLWTQELGQGYSGMIVV